MIKVSTPWHLMSYCLTSVFSIISENWYIPSLFWRPVLDMVQATILPISKWMIYSSKCQRARIHCLNVKTGTVNKCKPLSLCVPQRPPTVFWKYVVLTQLRVLLRNASQGWLSPVLNAKVCICLFAWDFGALCCSEHLYSMNISTENSWWHKVLSFVRR